MEFIPGRTLLEVMIRRGHQPFPVAQVVEWGISICEVLEAMHNHRPPLIHRDVKPDNVMLLDQQNTIKMIDFGAARPMTSYDLRVKTGSFVCTQCSRINPPEADFCYHDGSPLGRGAGRALDSEASSFTKVGSKGYTPREQFDGKPEPRSDLYALAATLYFLVSGKEPAEFDLARVIQTLLNERPSSLLPEDRWFYEILRINTAPDPANRYASAQEIREHLQARTVRLPTIPPEPLLGPIPPTILEVIEALHNACVCVPVSWWEICEKAERTTEAGFPIPEACRAKVEEARRRND